MAGNPSTYTPGSGWTRRVVAGTLLAGAVALGGLGVAALNPLAPAGAQDRAVAAEPSTGDGQARRAERLRRALEPLVEAGTIDADQADAVVTRLQEAGAEAKEGRGEGRRERRRAALGTAAAAIGIPADELATALRGGATVAEVAEGAGVDPATVTDALVAEANTRIDAAVAEGDLDAARADVARTRAAERIARFVEEGGGRR